MAEQEGVKATYPQKTPHNFQTPGNIKKLNNQSNTLDYEIF